MKEKSSSNLQEKQPQVKRRLGLSTAIALGVGTTIGSGIFSSIQEVALSVEQSRLLVVLSFLIGGLIMIPQNMLYAEYASAIPEDGSYIAYLRRAGWPFLSFLSGWIGFLATDSVGIAISSLAAANYMVYFTGWGPLGVKLIGSSIVVVFTILHMVKMEHGARWQNFITFVKVIPFILLIGMGVYYISRMGGASGSEAAVLSAQGDASGMLGTSGRPFWMLLIAGISATTWSYDGMQVAGFMGGEFKNPQRNMPIAMLSTVIFITVLYTLLSSVTLGLLPIGELVESAAPVAEAASRIPIIGDRAGFLAAVLALVVIVGSNSGNIMYTPRMTFKMARDGVWFDSWGKVHPKWGTPHVSFLWQAGLSLMFIWTSQIHVLLGYFTVVALMRNVLAFIAIFKLRKMPDYHPAYKTPFWRVTALLALVPTIILLLSTFLWSPLGSFLAAAIAILTGIPVYRYFAKKNNVVPHTGLEEAVESTSGNSGQLAPDIVPIPGIKQMKGVQSFIKVDPMERLEE
jgi:amino acid transporter